MRRFALLLLLLLSGIPAQAQTPGASPAALCRAAIQGAERAAGLPAGLLMAVARVESGRRDPETGRAEPWPWTINAEGRGQFLPSKAAAIAEVQALQARGVRLIDVGCMQVNLRHHPNAFASLDEAFDPATNARYAARFLTELRQGRPDWQAAAGAYHSQTEEYAAPYRARVLAAWNEERARPTPAPVALPVMAMARPFAGPGGGGGGMLDNGADRASLIASSAPGRGLDAYRSMPTPVAGRLPPRIQLAAR